MNKLAAVIQLITSALVSVIAVATIINLILISTRPETISVVNTLVGQGVLIILLLVMATVLFKKGLAGLKQEKLRVNSSVLPAAANVVKPVETGEDRVP